jgi:hypothetical protein
MNKTDLDTAQIIANLRDTARLQHGDRPGSIMHLAADCILQLQTQLDEARAEVERLKDHVPDATKMIRPEPSRLEIAAMLQAGWLANPESEIDNQHDWWLAQADALIEAAKGGAK